MELKDLVGKHVFQGIDLGIYSFINYMDQKEEANCLKFKMDGVVYVCKEDTHDGYRSYMMELETIVDGKLENEFDGIQVSVMHITKDAEDDPLPVPYEHDVIELVDCQTGKIVLTVGTKDTDDYYPYYIGEFHPENMSINIGR